MESNLLAATALVFGTTAIYVQLNIPKFAATGRTTLATRALLGLTGCGLGLISGALFPDDPGQAMLAFVSGFGVVHLPAAFILLLKRAERADH